MSFTPQTYTDFGASLTALETRISDAFASLATPAPPAWEIPTLLNGWVNYGAPYRDAGYRKLADGTVQLRGLIKSGTVGQPAFVLPVGYRPAGNILLIALSNSATGRVDVESDGTIRIQPPSVTGSWVGIDHIRFPAGS